MSKADEEEEVAPNKLAPSVRAWAADDCLIPSILVDVGLGLRLPLSCVHGSRSGLLKPRPSQRRLRKQTYTARGLCAWGQSVAEIRDSVDGPGMPKPGMPGIHVEPRPGTPIREEGILPSISLAALPTRHRDIQLQRDVLLSLLHPPFRTTHPKMRPCLRPGRPLRALQAARSYSVAAKPHAFLTPASKLLNRDLPGVSAIVLDRPEARNALSMQMVDELLEIMAKLPNDGTRVALLHANGPVFCAGADLRERKTMSMERVGHRSQE